jgi:hypothetical protein
VRQDSDDGDMIPYVTTGLVAAKAVIDQPPPEETRRAPKGRWASFGDILLQCRGIERRARVPAAMVRLDDDLAFAESLILVRIDPTRADPDYIRLYLASEVAGAALAAAATGTTISYLRPEALTGLRLSLPGLEVQREIAAKVTGMQANLRTIETTAATFRDLIDVASEGLLTGSLRISAIEARPHRARAGARRTADAPDQNADGQP